MEKKESDMGESSTSGFTDAVGVEDAKGLGQGKDGASSDLEYGESDNLEVTYDSWHMFEETMWATTLSNKTFEEKTMWSCFQLCYLFPKHYEFYKDDIIQLWLAQWVIPPVDDSSHMYFKAFQEMSIFQFSCLDYSTGGRKYKLNHSIVDLLQKHPDDKCFRVDDEEFHVTGNIMHSSVVCSLQSESFNRFCNAKKLCTLMILNEHKSYIEQVPRDLFLKLQYLRVLDFSHTSIRELPSTIRNLKDLRYLNLSQTLIKTLPPSLCSLHQMQTLKLRGCLELADLPKGLRKLRNLRYLDVDVACLLVSMPPGFGDLIELQGLPAFVVGKEEGYHINELKYMVNLHGALQIIRLENVYSAEEAKEAWMNKKTGLKKLEFQWTDLQDGYDILQNLEPHTELKELQVLGYGDVKFPEWIGSPLFSKLVAVSIHDCPKCELLPPLGTLPFLKDMSISEMHELKTIDGQFCGRYVEFRHGNESAGLKTVSGIVSEDGMPNAFLNLESFTLNGMPKLEQWIGIVKGDFPKLKKLHVFGCCMLKALPQFPLTNSIHRLEIRHCPLLEDIPNGGLLNSLEQLIIIDCPLVKEQFQKGQGYDGRNLAHIPNVWIDYLPFARIREMDVLEEEEEANGKRDETPTSEIELLEVVLDQVPENMSMLQLETEADWHSETKSAQAQKIQSSDSRQNMPGHSSQERMMKGQKSGRQKMGVSCWNKRKVRKSGGKKTALQLSAKNEKGYQVDSLTWSKDLGLSVNGEYSMAVVEANAVLEDQYQLESGFLSSSNSGPQGTFIGVYDGHGGPEAARYIKENLFNNVQKFTKENQDFTTDVIRRAYAATEAGFLDLVEKEWLIQPRMAAVGSGCLVGIICDEILYISNVGSSRVVLGRRSKESKGVDAIQLSVEHNADIESVRREMHSLHPDDPQIVVLKHNIWRVKGLIQVSRSIGDAYLKNAKFNTEPLHAKFRLREPFQRPILSSEPSVSVAKLKPEDLYLIFASDGLWEHLTNQEVANIVHQYPRNGIARRLVKEALKEAAKKREMKYSKLIKVERGVRRHFHDDITVIVVFTDSLMSKKSSRETNIPDSSKTDRDTCCPTFWKVRSNKSKAKFD